MGKLKTVCLMCFSIFIFSCANVNNISTPDSNVTPESVIDRTKRSVVMLSSSVSEETITDAKQSAVCAGVVINEEGHILTNFHCIFRYNYIKAYYWDKIETREHEVNVIGTDPLADLALLEVENKKSDVPYLKFAENTEDIKEGTEVIAIGHPASMVWTVTKGIISSNDRILRHPYIKSIQTDAAINLGNSGGPLLNMKGEVVGINTLIVSKISENAGVGLAIRGDIVKKSFESMLSTGRVDRPAVGIMIMPLAQVKQRDKIIKEFPKLKPKFIPNTFGVFVRPDENLPKGLKKFDTIIGVNGEMINDGLQFSDELSKYNIGETVTLTIVRKRRYLNVKVPLKVFPVNADKMYSKILKPVQPKKTP